jgi:hypothetical protein
VIYDDGFNYLTKMCLTNMREAAFRMCKIAKEKGCIVIVSSSDSTDRYEEYLNEGADFILLGRSRTYACLNWQLLFLLPKRLSHHTRACLQTTGQHHQNTTQKRDQRPRCIANACMGPG